ncbi:hypothetical protein J2X72_002575 [Phyllobacterium sp. 1468]|uniref:hypothetical protein n=1 Tax=Phyllobacterium sp. 1468 TaxID=2817759 RepID=UPI002855D427|nr:hypothetical protein [Phyllobacterium sp. 1468]MDR6633775.1 hypothetical protein [Phyllobacterium sp. 1468]
MRTDILFGIYSEDMEEIKELLEDILGRELEARESLQKGEYYCLGVFEDFLYLQDNENIEDGETVEDEFPEYPLILYINDADEYPHYLSAIEKRSDIFVKLRTEQWDPQG